MITTLNHKSDIYLVTFLLLAALFCTFFRISLLLLYPLVLIAIFYICNWKLQRNFFYILALIGFSWIISFRNGIYLKYNAVSLYYYLPFFLLLFASPQAKDDQPNYLRLLIKALTVIAIINNLFGIIQYAIKPTDDSFVGIYSTFTVSQNGLSILNAVLFFYYLNIYMNDRKFSNLILACFFIACCVLGFYGAGQLVLIVTLLLTYLKIKRKNLLQLVGLSILTISIVVLIMQVVSPKTLEYNVNIINKFLNPSAVDAPRKLTAFKNYIVAYPENPVDFLFGSGPGTFNSRSAFMVGSPTYFNVSFIKSEDQPYYFKRYAYPLWNETNTGPYDGFMNQPFSSLLSLLGEYGFLLTALLLIAIIYRFNYFRKTGILIGKSAGVLVGSKMHFFCSVYAFLLIMIDNYIEYPEIIGLLLIIAKLGQQEISKALMFTNSEIRS